MTAKRFVKTHKTINWWAVLDNGKELLEDEVVELLNELHEENTMLKERRHEDINELAVIAMKYQALEKENEQLKQQLFETSKELLWATSDDVDRALYFENEVEDLRKEIFE